MRSGDLLDQFAEGLRAELDFRREAEAMTEMAARLDGVAVRVPTVHQHLCTRRVLVQERFEGRHGRATSTRADAHRRSTGPTSPTSCCARRSTR